MSHSVPTVALMLPHQNGMILVPAVMIPHQNGMMLVPAVMIPHQNGMMLVPNTVVVDPAREVEIKQREETNAKIRKLKTLEESVEKLYAKGSAEAASQRKEQDALREQIKSLENAIAESLQQGPREDREADEKRAAEEQAIGQLENDKKNLLARLADQESVSQKNLEQAQNRLKGAREHFAQQLRLKDEELERLSFEVRPLRELKEANKDLAYRISRMGTTILELKGEIHSEKQTLKQLNVVGANIARRQALLDERLAQHPQHAAVQKAQAEDLIRKDRDIVDREILYGRQSTAVAGLRTENRKLQAEIEKLKEKFNRLKSVKKKQQQERKVAEQPIRPAAAAALAGQMFVSPFPLALKKDKPPADGPGDIEKALAQMTESSLLLLQATQKFQTLTEIIAKQPPKGFRSNGTK